MGCCGGNRKIYTEKIGQKKSSNIINKWIFDKNNRKLLIIKEIYDSYNDIIGYVTKDIDGKIFRIFAKDIIKIIDNE